MVVVLNTDKIPSILKECFLFYSYKIHNYIISIDGKVKYDFNYTENSALYNFANFLKENKKHYLTIDWLFDYFNYQFSYWNFIKESKEKDGGLYLIQLHWILGKKALKRFNEKTQKDSYFYHSNFFPKFQIKKEDLIEVLQNKNLLETEEEEEVDKIIIFNGLNKREEELKQKRYNTIEGLEICLNFTTLFRFDSPLCENCNYRMSCKKTLRKNFPKIFQKRVAQKFVRYSRKKK